MLFKNTLKTFGFIGILILLAIFLKITFILYLGVYHHKMPSWDTADILLCLYNSMQYDNRNIAFFGILYFLLSFVFKNKGVGIYVSIIYSFYIFLNISNMLFYIIYDDTFNSNLLGFIFDDKKAIFQTGISGEYFLSIKILCAIMLSFFSIWCYKKSLSLLQKIPTPPLTFIIISTICLLFSFVFMINASFSLKGKSLDQQITFSRDLFLKNITTDSLRSLYLVYKGYKAIQNSKMQDFYPQDIHTTLKQYFNLKKLPENLEIYELLKQYSHNTSQQKINHIFYIVSESLSQWHFDTLYDSIDMLSATKKIINNNPHALYFDTFLENAPSTAKSLQSQITGLLQLDIPLQNLIGKIPTFKTAIANQAKILGYKTTFYYGGGANWQKLESFSKTQGFDNFIDKTNLLDFLKNQSQIPPKPYENIWGISDNILFDFILTNTAKTPSFSMIMTTSNHPPYDIPLEKYNVPMEKITHFIKDQKLSIDPKILGHVYWYDKILANFIQNMSKKYPDSLFIITGDHYDRNYPKNANLRITKQIPLIIYAPNLILHKTTNLGSHIDITPTILEIIAPKNFSYPSFGKPLASTNPHFKIQNHIALGYFVIANHQMLYDNNDYFLYNSDSTPNILQAQKDYTRLNQARAISWYLLFKNSKVSK